MERPAPFRRLRPDHYLLDDDGEPQPLPVWGDNGGLDVDALLQWGRSFESADRQILRTEWPRWGTRRESFARYRVREIGVTVSTVFLGLDHSFGRGDPVLWETMIFGSPFHNYQARYRSQLDALRGHQLAVDLLALYRRAPRRLKKALAKFGRGLDLGYLRAAWGHGEPRRVARALARLTHPEEGLTPLA